MKKRTYAFIGVALILLTLFIFVPILSSPKTQSPVSQEKITPLVSDTESTHAQQQPQEATTTPIQVMGGDAFYAHNYFDPQYLVGASNNVFIGKVVEQVGTDNFFNDTLVRTQFNVEVLYNIKGNLSGIVVVDQPGGYRDGVLYVVADDSYKGGVGVDNILRPGSTYLLATRGSGKKDEWLPKDGLYPLPSHPAHVAFISNDATLTRETVSGTVN